MRECGSSVKRERCRFWNSLLDKSDNKTVLFKNIRKITKDAGIHAGIGKAGFNLGYIGTDDITWVELNINIKGNPEETEKIYKELLADSWNIGRKYPELKITWNPKEKRTVGSHVILSYSDKGGIGNKDKWNDIQNDLVERMIRFEKIFKDWIEKR